MNTITLYIVQTHRKPTEMFFGRRVSTSSKQYEKNNERKYRSSC